MKGRYKDLNLKKYAVKKEIIDMFETYSTLFDARGHLYHQAMKDFPAARKAEFDTVIDWLDLTSGMSICDVPSGGGYLSNYITHNNINFYFVETSQVFSDAANILCNKAKQDIDNIRGASYKNIVCDSITTIPLNSDSVNRVVSLSGLHHEVDPPRFYTEAARLLSDDGLLVLADVKKGSGVAGFLNEFVDQHSSMGHEGRFFCEQTLVDVEQSGYTIIATAHEHYTWRFSSTDEMVNYCKMLFGIDEADNATILKAINDYLGYTETEKNCLMNWDLMFIKAAKSKSIL